MVARIAQALVAKYGEKVDTAATLAVTLFDPDGNVVDPADRAAIRFARFHWTGWRLLEPYQAGQSTTDYVIESVGGTAKWAIAITTLSASGKVIAAKADGELTPTVATFLTRLATKL